MSSKNFYGLTGDVTIDGGILNVSNIATIGTTKTFVVTVGGNGKYFIDGVDRPLLELHEHQTYKFDFSSSTLLAGGGHPFIFSETANGGAYTSGITTTGTYGSDEIRTFVVPTGAPSTLYYYCTNHSGMGARVSISPTAELVVAPLGQGRVVTDFVSSKRSLIRNVETIGTTKTFVVTVQQVNNVNKYHIDGVDRPLIELHEHQTYIFDITASNAGGHPFRLATSSTWANPNTDNYDNGVDLSDPDKFIFTVPAGAPTTLYYYCTQHSGMGATISISPESELIVSGRIVASGNVEASKITASTFVGDGSLLTGISTVTSSGLQVVTDNSPTTTNTIEFTNPTTSLRASSNIVATGNVTADHFVGDGSQLSGIVTSVSLGDAVNTGNITSNTVQFTNTSTSLTASGNVEVAGNVVTSGNVEAAYFIGDGSKLSGIVTSVTLGDAVDSGNTTSNTVQFTNTSTSLTASGNVEVTGNVVAGYFIGDGSQLTGLPSGGGGSGTSHWTKTSGTNELYYTAGSVGISNANPIHDLSVGSNLYVDDDATDGILKVTGNVNATYFVGDGSRLVNLPSGGGTSAWTTATGIIHYPQNPTTTSINVGIMNNTPQHTLSVGSNLFVDDTGSNVLVVDGDITAESMFLGALGIKPSYPLETVTDAGNVTPHTISFTNPTLGFITASNVEIGGELVIGKGTIGGSNLEVGEANLFVNTELTRVGIGTDQPAATLHVNGSLAVDGPLTFGTVDVAAQHGLEAITAVSNTTPLTIELQNADTSLVTTGNVEVGGELTVSGNAIVSSNLTVSGNTFYTSPMSISVDSNVVTEYTGPHDRPLRKYPEVELDVNAMTSPGVGGYIVAHSGRFSTPFAGWTAFGEEFTTTNAEATVGAWLDGSPGSYAKETADAHNGVVGSITTAVQTAGTLKLASNTPVGAWISLELPTSIKLQRIEMRARLQHASETDLNEVALQSFPREFGIWGYDGSSWVLLKSVTGHSANSAFGYTPTHVNATTAYNKYAIVVTRTNAVGGSNSDDRNFTAIGQLYFYGYEEGDASLDTTLKSVYNVPATTGTQLEVYYDAKDLTTMPSTVTDLSPRGRNSTATNVTIDSTWNAFRFSGSGSETKIEDFTISGGDYVHSISLWFNSDEDYTDITSPDTRKIFFLGADVTSGSAATDGVSALQFSAHDNSNEGYLRWYHWGNDTNYNIKLRKNEWYHVTLIYKGGTSDTQEVYVNNEFIEPLNSGNSSNPISLPTTIDLFLGRGRTASKNAFKGMIANFRLYSKALNADQVKELYDYQKDYFLGSKSQVTLYKGHLGVGVTEPSGQLELAGDERIQEYPPRDLGGFETMIEGEGTYKVSSSSDVTNPSVGSSDHPAIAFTANDTFFRGVNSAYNTSSVPATYTGTHFTNGVGGDFLQIELPHKINLKSINITSRTNGSVFYDRGPHTGSIFGSNNGGTTWSQVASWTGLNWTLGESKPIQINSNTLYSTYRLVASEIQNDVGAGATRFNIDRWQLFGTPGPTTLDKGSLSLGRSLDVPRVSRYDVDTETPRPEKLLVDFDTTVNSSPTDISGRGNHGVFRESASYSPADKAFNLDGTNKNIRAELNNTETGNQYHSVSLWFKILSGRSSNWRNIFECGENPRSGTSDISLYIPGGQDKLSFTNGVVHMYSDTLTNLYFQWHHIVLTYDGANRNMYLDGALIKTLATTSWAGVANMSLTLGKNNASSAGGEGCDCHVSNFKLYWQTALEPSEVKKLYNLGRTGRSTVISDTAVGIGKVPEAQLDVRGTISTTSDIQVYSQDGISKIRTGKVGMFFQNSGRTIDPDTNFSPTRPYSIWESNVGGEGSYIAINGDNIVMSSPCDDESLRYYDEDNGDEVWNISNAGALVVGSDSRRKHDIKPVIWENVLKKIGNIEPSTFKFKTPESYTRVTSKWDKEHIGFIAQNVQENFPELVTEDGSSENYLLVNSSMMILPIIQGIQQLTNELEAEKAKNESLEARVTALENA